MTDPLSKSPGKIRSMFDRIAGRYDLLNRVLTAGLDGLWRRRLLRRVRGPSVLDLACGSGDILDLLAKRDDVGHRVGLDFSARMLDRARARLNPSRSTNSPVALLQGDALQLPLREARFSSITCAFGVRNFQDRDQAFRECHRVLEPGGRLLILEFFPPEPRWWNAPLRWYLRQVLPTIGSWISGSEGAYEYLQESIEAFIKVPRCREELRRAGFEDVTVTYMMGRLVGLVEARKEVD